MEGNPFITRFKTEFDETGCRLANRIEGNPFITRFKTLYELDYWIARANKVLKVIHL